MAIMFFFISVNLYLCLCIFSILIILSWCLVGEGGPRAAMMMMMMTMMMILIILSWCLVGAGSPRATMIASTGGIIFLAVGENQPL